MNITPKTLYIIASAMSQDWPQAVPETTSAMPPKQRRKKLKGWQKKGKQK